MSLHKLALRLTLHLSIVLELGAILRGFVLVNNIIVPTLTVLSIAFIAMLTFV